MKKSKFQEKLEKANTVDVLAVLDELGERLAREAGFPPLIPIVGQHIQQVVREARGANVGVNRSIDSDITSAS
jgi:hypothetical protein